MAICYDKKKDILDERIKPYENEVRTLEENLKKCEGEYGENHPNTKKIETELERQRLISKDKKSRWRILKKLVDGGKKEEAWWIIRNNILKYIESLEKDLEVFKKEYAEIKLKRMPKKPSN